MTILKNLSALFVSLALSAVLTATAQAGGDKWALLIGVDMCEAVGKLTVCSADALALKSVLEQIGYPANHISMLVDNQSNMNAMPTIGNVERSIKRLAQVAEADDTVLFFFSGHGVTANDGTSFLVPTDGDLTKGVSLTWIKDQFAACKASEKVMILDACHSGAAKGVSGITPDLKTSGNLVMLLSCGKEQVSWPDTDGQHSVFTSALLEGLSGKAANADRKVTHQTLATYVGKCVKEWTYGNQKNEQTPVMVAENSGDIVLADLALMKPAKVSDTAKESPAAARAIAMADGKWLTESATAYALSRKLRCPILVFVFATNIDTPTTTPVLQMMDDSLISEFAKGWLPLVKIDLTSVTSKSDEDKQFVRQLVRNNKISKFPVLLMLNGNYQAEHAYSADILQCSSAKIVEILSKVKMTEGL